MKQLTIEDLENLSVGSAVLGSGGGGDSSYAILMAQQRMEKHGPLTILSIDELQEDDCVVPLSLMGAPLITMERLLSGNELRLLLKTVDEMLKRKPTVLMAAEIGGANAFTPLLAAAITDLPVLDADLIGRAFPELHMSSAFLKKRKSTPAVVVDCLGNRAILETKDAKTLENMARSLTVAMGSSSAVGFFLMNGLEVPGSVVPGTLSHALRLGEAIRTSSSPVETLTSRFDARTLGQGTVIDIDQVVKDGFLQGSVTLLDGSEKIELFYQNEYLLAKNGKEILATTPDILFLLDENSAAPITSEALRYGLQATLLALTAPEIWQASEGLALVGPRAFGYDIDYRPLSKKESL